MRGWTAGAKSHVPNSSDSGALMHLALASSTSPHQPTLQLSSVLKCGIVACQTPSSHTACPVHSLTVTPNSLHSVSLCEAGPLIPGPEPLNPHHPCTNTRNPCLNRTQPRAQVEGRTGRQQVAAAYAVYGPQTMLVWARPHPDPTAAHTHMVQQFLLGPGSSWVEVPPPEGQGGGPLINADATTFAPANLRAAAHNKVGLGPGVKGLGFRASGFRVWTSNLKAPPSST